MILAHLVTATGWTWDYCRDHMDLPRLFALNAYWVTCPPVHVVARRIALTLGVEFEDQPGGATEPEADQPGLADLLASIPEVSR